MTEDTLQLLTIKEVARLMQLEEHSVGSLAEEGRLPARMIAGEWRFPRRDLERYVLADGEADYRDFYLRAIDMHFTLEADELTVRAFNPAVERTAGYSPDDLIGEPFSLLYDPPARTRWAKGEEILRKTGRLDCDNLRIARKDGSAVDVRVYGGAVRDETDRITHYQLIVRDLSEQRSAEEAASFLQDGVDRRIEISTHELRQANLTLSRENSDLRREAADRRKEMEEERRRATTSV